MGFDYRENQLHCDGVSMQEIASRVGTPFYCYSTDIIREHYCRYRDQFSIPGSVVCYAVKANSNPSVLGLLGSLGAGTHEKITTGKVVNKFGIPRSRALEIYARAAGLPGIRVQGIATHIGSQLTDLAPFEQSFRCHARLVQTLREQGHDISVLDIGGGLGIDYGDGAPLPPRVESYAALAREILEPLDCRLLVEPGRSIVGEAGVLVSRVIYVKEGEQVRFLIIDAGMNDLLRPSLYDAHHEITAVSPADGPVRPYDVVGPICETGDTFARQLDLPVMSPGELVAIRNAGAYGAVMASTYNSRSLIPEVMVGESCVSLVRRRVEVDEEVVLGTSP